MTKFSSYRGDSRSRQEKQQVHPIWRGVGFIFLILAPLMGWFGAQVLLDANQANGWFRIPSSFLAPGADSLLFVKIGLTIILAFLIFFVLQFIGVILYRMVGPERYGPLDVPPITGVKKRKAR